jgi:hypothetical protein
MKNNTISKLTEKYLKETDDNIIGVSYTHNIVGGMIKDKMVLSFIVKKKLPLNELKPEQVIPSEITYYGTTFKTDVVQGDIVLLEDCTEFAIRKNNTVSTNRSKVRPLKGGLSTTNYTSLSSTVGTMGFIAVDNTDNALVGVSNNHVYIDDAFIATERTNPSVITNISGDGNVQPHPTDSYYYNGDSSVNYIGKVKRYVPLKSTISNKVDGALTTLNSNVISNTESYKYEGLTGITTALPFATTAEINELILYNRLYSAGRTTGAKGETDIKLLLTSKNASINISYHKQGGNQTIVMTDCLTFIASGASTPSGYACSYPIAGGDSGSALIGDVGGIKKIVGLVFAGSEVDGITTTGIACRIDNVASELNIRAWLGEATEYSSSTVQELIVSGLDNRTYIDSGGKRYYQAGLTNSAVT